MISFDTNILFHAFNADSPFNGTAYDWLAAQGDSEEIAISEFVLAELYRLVRNPITASAGVLSPQAACNVIDAYRNHPRWMLIGFSANSRSLHDRLWRNAAKPDFAYRKLYDVRTALTLIEGGVTDFATVNTKDFEGLGFAKVWNPLAEGGIATGDSLREFRTPTF